MRISTQNNEELFFLQYSPLEYMQPFYVYKNIAATALLIPFIATLTTNSMIDSSANVITDKQHQ